MQLPPQRRRRPRQHPVLVATGPRVAAGVLFPLAYMAFLVPFGDEIVPMLQTITATMAIELTQMSGVPAEIDGVFIDTPAGLFEVAEACSGVKFLVAMVALGTLVAHLCFRSWKRRALFMAAAVVVPVLANGVRAWGTIYIAHSQGIEFAAGICPLTPLENRFRRLVPSTTGSVVEAQARACC